MILGIKRFTVYRRVASSRPASTIYVFNFGSFCTQAKKISFINNLKILGCTTNRDILSVQLHNLGHTSDNSVRLLVGSRHHFDLVKICLGHNNGISTIGESTRILTLASGSSTGAISATEVRFIYLSKGQIKPKEDWHAIDSPKT